MYDAPKSLMTFGVKCELTTGLLHNMLSHITLLCHWQCKLSADQQSCVSENDGSKKRHMIVGTCVSHASAFQWILWLHCASTNNCEENPAGHDYNLSTKGRNVHCCPSRQQGPENRPHAWESHVFHMFNGASQQFFPLLKVSWMGALHTQPHRGPVLESGSRVYTMDMMWPVLNE